jgi:hypothetical protein
VAHVVDRGRVFGVRTVRKVEPEHVDARRDKRAQHFRIARGRADGRDDLRALARKFEHRT